MKQIDRCIGNQILKFLGPWTLSEKRTSCASLQCLPSSTHIFETLITSPSWSHLSESHLWSPHLPPFLTVIHSLSFINSLIELNSLTQPSNSLFGLPYQSTLSNSLHAKLLHSQTLLPCNQFYSRTKFSICVCAHVSLYQTFKILNGMKIASTLSDTSPVSCSVSLCTFCPLLCPRSNGLPAESSISDTSSPCRSVHVD